MELMKGRILWGQLGVISLVAFLFAIAYGAGVWWSLELSGLEVSMTLWKICTVYGENDVCDQITADNMGEVILTTRACGGISIILLIAVLIFTILLVCQQRRSDISDDHWLYARAVLLLLLVLFLLITVAHSENCPPKYRLGETFLNHNIGWAWVLAFISLVFSVFVCGIHLFESIQLYRENINKK